MARKETLTFEVLRKDILASNIQEFHYTKGKKVSSLRNLAVIEGLKRHKLEDVEKVQERVDALIERQAWQTKKTAESKKLKKKGLTKAEIDAELNELYGTKASYEKVDAIKVPFLFPKAKIKVLIGNTVNRDFDPPNYWPTIKAITDGLTDCAWWEDDNFNYVTEVSFAYGERSELKGHYKFTLIIEEVLD